MKKSVDSLTTSCDQLSLKPGYQEDITLFRQTGVKQQKLLGCDGVTSRNYLIVTKER
jgi:hypothetical protein